VLGARWDSPIGLFDHLETKMRITLKFIHETYITEEQLENYGGAKTLEEAVAYLVRSFDSGVLTPYDFSIDMKLLGIIGIENAEVVCN
jgi:hypothetical protein